ncbi:MAG: SDR family oxidoreductase [Proteobacteria bacterium]|nr:SDR family oxidoreductase [Pseudomonadota bacterium]MDA1325226.1 SDR family oxidoreductase [Pseudomonadota bacterium]
MASNDRIVLITGAASGIGAVVCRRIAGQGTKLLIHARHNQAGLDAVADAARKAGSAVVTALGDLTEPDVPARLINATVQEFGTIDQIVSNAGFAQRGNIDANIEHLTRAERGMPEAFFRMASTALPYLEKSTCGRVVAVSSFVAHVFAADGLFAVTAAAKAALEALAKTLAVQLAPSGATVNCIAPGYTKKDATGHSALSEEAWAEAARKIPMGRIGTPDDAAALIEFLLSDDAGFITGQIIHVDGGLTLA